jgi:hypothetical protein
VCARLKRPPDSSLLGYDGEKDTPMPIGLTKGAYCALSKGRRVRFQKANVLRFFTILSKFLGR